MDGERQAILAAIGALLGPLLTGLETLVFVARNLHPPHLAQLVEAVADRAPPLRVASESFSATPMPAAATTIGTLLNEAATATLRAYDELFAAPASPDGVFIAYRALRHIARANEALYGLCSVLPPVSAYFLAPPHRKDAQLLGRVNGADGRRENLGLRHMGNARQERGGYSLYVPEYLDENLPAPLVMALHGGSGHGRDFLWSWLADARSHGAMLVCPTSQGSTWSLMEPEIDGDRLLAILDEVRGLWPVDESRLLLTGMSDGGTFTYLAGLREGAPFTHLAPVAASFHPMLLGFLDRSRLSQTPVTLIHGALDWMFAVDMARAAHDAFVEARATVQYREIADLSHTYPREENDGLLRWLQA